MYKQEKGRASSGQAQNRWTVTFVSSCTAQQASAAVAQGRCSALSGIHCDLRAAVGTEFQTKYGAPAPGFPLPAGPGPKPLWAWGITLLALQPT